MTKKNVLSGYRR